MPGYGRDSYGRGVYRGRLLFPPLPGGPVQTVAALADGTQAVAPLAAGTQTVTPLTDGTQTVTPRY